MQKKSHWKNGQYGRGSLDTGDGVIYFKKNGARYSRGLCIKYENEVPADAELYNLVSRRKTLQLPAWRLHAMQTKSKDESSHGETDRREKNRVRISLNRRRPADRRYFRVTDIFGAAA